MTDRDLPARDDDERLAEHLEGLLGPEATAALEARLVADPALRARREALARLLPTDPTEPAELAPVALPAGLAEQLGARLQREGLLPAEAPPAPDAALAEHLEGLLEPAAAAALEARLAADPALRARHEALARVALERLDAATPPVGLLELTLARLEEEGLVTPGGQGAPPPRLLPDTLRRLEAEGLLAPSGPRGLLLRLSRSPVALAAAALLLCCGAFQLGGLYQRRPALERLRERDATIDALLAESRRLREEAAARVVELAVAREQAGSAGQELSRLRAEADVLSQARQDLLVALGREQAKRVELELEATEVEALRREREALLARLAALPAPGAGARQGELQARVADLERALAGRDEELADLRIECAAALEALQQARIALQEEEPASMYVSDARRIDRWDPARREWRPVEGATQLQPGAIVRGAGAQGAIVLQDRKLELRGGTYVVTGARRLDPLPEGTGRAAPALREAAGGIREQVPLLIARLGSGNTAQRAAAQRQLSALWQRYPDPGPGVMARITQAALREDAPGPPATPQGWESWWSRVEEQVPAGE